MSSPTVFCAEGFALDGLGNCLPTSPGVGAPVRSVLAPSPQKRTSSQGFSSCPAGQAYNAARGGCFPLTPTPPLPTCPGGSHYSSASKTCIHDCPPGQTYDENHGGCVSPCPPGKELNITGDCVKSGPETCPIGQIFNAIELRCVSQCAPSEIYDIYSGCVPACPKGFSLNVTGDCVSNCPKGFEENVTGDCVKVGVHGAFAIRQGEAYSVGAPRPTQPQRAGLSCRTPNGTPGVIGTDGHCRPSQDWGGYKGSKGGFLVQAGESTSAVAARAGVAVEALVAANPTVPRVLVGGRAVFAVLREGQELLLP